MKLESDKNFINPVIFRAYDIRGIYPEEINEAVVEAVARAFCVFLGGRIRPLKRAYGEQFRRGPKKIVLGRDARLSGPALFRAAKKAILESGVDVIDAGVTPADVFYFAVNEFKADGGIFISASHNPREWNGLNLCRRGAEPISGETGLKQIYELASIGARLRPKKTQSRAINKDVTERYLNFVYKLAPIKNAKPLKIVINGNFGVSARVFRRLVRKFRLPFKLIGLNEAPDGRFPKGPPNPHLPKMRRETERLVKKSKADLGIAWDADGDRSFFVDEKGNSAEGYYVIAVLAEEMLGKYRGATIITDPRVFWAAQGVVKNLGGKFTLSKPGMTIIAARMKKEKAVFAGETSGHYYFKSTFYRDSGILPALILINKILKERKTLSQIIAPLARKYFISGEINFHLKNQPDAKKILRRIERLYKGGRRDRLAGTSVSFRDWRFNVRASNTEPLLRLNVEAKNPRVLKKKTAELERFLGNFGKKSAH